MIFNILGLIAGPIMIKTGHPLLVVLGWLWSATASIGIIWLLINLFMGMRDR